MELLPLSTQSSSGIPSVSLSDNYEYIVAIDLGTIYSGFAYANKDDIDFETGKIDIHYNQPWNAGIPNLISRKTPTCVLLNKELELVSFGYQAEKKFCQLVEKKQTDDFYCFRRFKMVLYEKNPKVNMLIKDETGKELTSSVVFSRSIFALKKAFFEQMETQGIHLHEREIRWVVTVPAIWSDAAKQFMRTCSIEAGIPNNQLILALEPEAASIWCQFVKSKEVTDTRLTVSKPGTQYVVVDLGGGTVDITVHEKLENGHLREIDAARGEDCGGNSINESLIKELFRTFGGPIIMEIKTKYPSVYLDVHRNFEAAKKEADPDSDDPLTLRLPQAFLDIFISHNTGESLLETIREGPHARGVSLSYDGVNIEPQLIKLNLFQPTVDRILKLLNTIIERIDNSKLTKILLVGGLSDSKYIQRAIRSKFQHKQVITPEDPALCVVKGAVLFGSDPNLISHRVVRFTYGIEVNEKFDHSVHDPAKRCIIDGEEKCKNVFSVHVKTGRVVEMNETKMKTYKTPEKYQKRIKVSIYISTREEPKYVDEPDCSCIGYLEVAIPDPTEEKRSVEVSLVFGNTELNVLAKDVKSGKECKTSLDFVHF